MRIKLLTLSAGPDGVNPPGSIVDVPEAQAEQMIRDRCAVAEPVRTKPLRVAEIETAAVSAPETADVKHKGRRKADL